MAKISIVMSVHNKAHYIGDLLKRIKEIEPMAEIIIVNDGSTDNTNEIVKKYADIYLETNDIWEVKANNIGLKAAKGDYVVIIQDDDLLLQKNSLSVACELMLKNDIGILGGRGIGSVYFKDKKGKYKNQSSIKLSLGKKNKTGIVQHFYELQNSQMMYRVNIFYKQKSFFMKNFGRFYDIIHKKIFKHKDKNAIINSIPKYNIYEVDITIRSPLIISQKVIQDVGYLDEDFAPLGYDDHDYCMQAQKKGYKVAFTYIPHISRFAGGSSWLYTDEKKIDFVDLLHSDIQGAELDMLKGAEYLLINNKVGYIFISTHSNSLHDACVEYLKKRSFLILKSINLDESYSWDGLIVAKGPKYKSR